MYDRKGNVVDASIDPVIVSKLFGPTVFKDLRITADRKECCWIIERLTILPRPDPDDPNTIQDERWVEWCRIPGQFKWEFETE